MDPRIIDPLTRDEIVAAHLSANGAWMLVSCALALFAALGLAFYYGGMVRAQHIMGVLIQVFCGIGVVTLLWPLIGYTVAFGPADGLWGGLDYAGLRHLGDPVTAPYTAEGGGTPTIVVVTFQLMVAVIAVALIIGATAGRLPLGAFALFAGLWSVLVYAPVAHWVWSPNGWLFRRGALDFAGGTVVHVNAGVAAVVLAVVFGPRGDWRDPALRPRGGPDAPSRRVPTARPHHVPLVLVGAGMLWFGWFGLTAGSALGSGELAGWAFLNTQVAAAAAMICWVLFEWLRDGKPTPLGAVSGAVAGLVAITPGCGFVSPMGALAVGAVAGIGCPLAIALTRRRGLDDALGVGAIHFTGAIVGTLMVGLFATPSTGGSTIRGVFYGGSWRLFAEQLLAVGCAIAYSATVTLGLALLARRAGATRFGAARFGPRTHISGHTGQIVARMTRWRAFSLPVIRSRKTSRPEVEADGDRALRDGVTNWLNLSGGDGNVTVVSSAKVPEETQA
ncbi:ammonium transporter [Frankia sp. CNm7]|uniref:Ammonium transporter n=1 Tax=Frankia nepalensis TaxID=1836974 RepID=A0A937RJZ9_9ACTN|nr:ammonium transporter [Frankia nepalensis]MBL7496174.1 ammonium transporter [Frankia nepalensis]MBL7511584.1 ammonium transporter [Frankia nepalensis]MBL7520646.1 ammonium transporter [Frankia nepalensis]MBL7630259.1 ammonium transporter [Frankia nepalensis]